MTRDPLVDKKLAMKERLPDLCRILKAYPIFDSCLRLYSVSAKNFPKVACRVGEIFKKFSRHLEFFRQWKTRERKKVLPKG